MPTQTLSDRRRALDALDTQLRTTVVEPIKAAWTAPLVAAAKPVTDVWPDMLAAAVTKLQMAFAVYRPLVEVEVPVVDRGEAVRAIDDAAAVLADDLAATSAALVAAKEFKTEAEKATIDRARDTMDRAAVALTAWTADFHRFDASVKTTSPPDPPDPPGPPPPERPGIETYTLVGNNNPYSATVRATIASAGDWASTRDRPDKTLGGVPLRTFGSVVARAELAASASSAKVRLEVTIEADPRRTFAFTYDQALVLAPPVSFPPIEVRAGSVTYVITQSAREGSAGKPELVVVFSEKRGA